MEIRGINKKNILNISKIKNEYDWVKDFRLSSYERFKKLKLPFFGPKINLKFNEIIYYKSSDQELENDWNKVNKNIVCELNDLGVMESERHLDGIGVQYESDVIYHNMIQELTEKSIIFTSIEEAIKKYPKLVKKYFGRIVTSNENKFTALNGAVFSGGSFIYIPPYTKLERPLQSYFRINSKNMGQFERTLIIVDHDSELHYIEGCTAPQYNETSLHAAVVEIAVLENSKCRYTTIQNWAHNVYNLVTKRALVLENGIMEWIDGNIGSLVTMKYPCCLLKGDYSKGVCITISVGTNNQNQDSGARMIHLGKKTVSRIISKSISKNGGSTTYRGSVNIHKKALNSKAFVKCDTLILDNDSTTNTIPKNILQNRLSSIEHEATISKISKEQLFYLATRGISEEKAKELIVLGFLDDFRDELPMEYAVELNRLLKENL